MMTKLTTTNLTAPGKSNYANGKSTTTTKMTKEASFDKLVNQHLDNSEIDKNVKFSNQSRTEIDNGIEKREDGVQGLAAYEDATKLDNLKKSFQKSNKDEEPGKPLQELDAGDDEGTEELVALVASLQKLLKQDSQSEDGSKIESITNAFSDIMKEIKEGALNSKDNQGRDESKIGSIANAFSDIMEEIKEGALNSKDSLGKSSMEKLTELLGKLGDGSSLDGVSAESSKSLVEMITSLVNALKTAQDKNSVETEIQKLETVRALGKQLLSLIDQILGKDRFSEVNEKSEGNDNRSINAMLQLIVNRTNMLIKAGTENQSSTETKNEIGNKMKETIEAILAASNPNLEDNLKSLVEQLVANLFSKQDAGKNQSVLNGILQKYGLASVENLNSSNTLDFNELKERLTNVLMMMAKDVNAEKSNTTSAQGKSSIIDRFAKILEGNMDEKNSVPANAVKSTTTDGVSKDNKVKVVGDIISKSESKEEKLLNSILGKENNEIDSKTEKVNNFMSQLNSSKDEISTEKSMEKPQITKSNFSQDIIKTVKYMNLNNLKELTVKIAPKELGEITIKITMTEGNIKANISANTKDAFNLLSNHIGEITTSLGNNDIKIQETSINIYQEDASLMRDSSNNNEHGQSNKNRNARQNETAGSSDTIDGVIEDDNNISILV